MLNIGKVAKEIPAIREEIQKEIIRSRQRLGEAFSLLTEAAKKQDAFIASQQQWQNGLIFTAATPVEAIDNKVEIPPALMPHSVFSTDGSQITPSHHEIAYCYLINIGRVMVHYHQNLHPLLDSIPRVYYKSEELQESRQWGIRTEEWLAYKRNIAEAQILSEMACKWVKRHANTPNLAMMDGSLIYWYLENLPSFAREEILNPILAAWRQLEENNIPLVGYVSASRSSEAINFLRFPACPYSQPDCLSYCGGEEEETPCQKIEPLRDVTFWKHILPQRHRSAIFRSNSRILEYYGPSQQIYFCYLHVGSEIARIEFPAWVASNPSLLQQALSITLTQVDKGFGYPVILAEAHNLAVVKGSDRTRFFALLQEEMIKAGLTNVAPSYKEIRKRTTIV